MSPSLSPPGQPSDVRAKSALVVAPHYDDEVLGCGGLIARLTEAGAAVRVLFLSDSGDDGDSDGDKSDRRAYAERRRTESQAAAEVLGIAGRDDLDLPDGRLEQHLEAIAEGLRRALLSLRPELLLIPSPLETSSDHRAAFAAVHRLLGELRSGSPGTGSRDKDLAPLVRKLAILVYEINHPQRPDLLIDVSDQVDRIKQAMACYASQQERHDYLAAGLGLARFRTLTLDPGISHAEAYRRLTVEDFTTRSPARLIAELGGNAPRLRIREGPAISVIVRTKDRPELLAEALASLAASTYRRADVVIVNDGGKPPEPPTDFPLQVQVVDLASNQGRAAAANAGLTAAAGDYVAFLDDDDLADPEHLATLAGLIQADGVQVAYTDAAVGIYQLTDKGWQCNERRLPYSRDFDPELLLVDNYIPFNTVVIDRRLALEAGPLDTELAFFEDWDFLIRLAALTPFHHLPRVTCEYRHFRGGGHHILGDRPRERADFLAMKARVIRKHGDRWTPDVAARVVDRLRAETIAEADESRRQGSALKHSEERYHLLNGELASLAAHHQALKEREEQLRGDVADLRRGEREHTVALHERESLIGEQGRALEERGEALGQAFAEIERLNALIRAMESSRAWRLHQWLQRWKA